MDWGECIGSWGRGFHGSGGNCFFRGVATDAKCEYGEES